MNLTSAPLFPGTTLLTIAATDPESAVVTYGLIGNYEFKIKSYANPENSFQMSGQSYCVINIY